jgi:DNA-binding NarL/FixJ family response regulator
MSIRLFVADDHVIVLAGLKSLLRGSGIEVVGEAATSEAAVRLAEKHHPNVVMLDVRMPKHDGLWALARIRQKRPDLPVLMWSAFDDPAFVARSIALGANGYLVKTATKNELVKAIRTAAAGGTTWTRAELRRVPRVLATPRLPGDAEASLTQRESDVLKQLALGASNRDIAIALGIAYDTAKKSVGSTLRKIGTEDRTQAAIWAVRKKLA